MITRYLVRLSRGLLQFARTLVRAAEEGMIPHPSSPTVVEENIAWGSRWLAAAIGTALAGEAVHPSRTDLIMLALFAASVVVRRRVAPAIVYLATQAI